MGKKKQNQVEQGETFASKVIRNSGSEIEVSANKKENNSNINQKYI